MYGIPGNRYGNMIRVASKDLPDLVKEAQVENQPSRTFFIEGFKKVNLSFDGMYLVDIVSGELVDERRFADCQITTPILS